LVPFLLRDTFPVSETVNQMIVYKALGLEKCVDDCGAHKAKAPFFEILRDPFGKIR
jgi:hypothetical protein